MADLEVKSMTDSSKRLFQCPKCSATFEGSIVQQHYGSESDALRAHMLERVTGDELPQRKCDSCVKTEKQQRADRDRHERIERAIFDSGLPSTDRDIAKFLALKVTGAQAVMRERVKDINERTAPKPWLYCSGDTGVGKTTELKLGVLREIDLLNTDAAARRFIPARFTTVPEFLLELRATMSGKGGPTESAVIEKYASVPFLVLDDIGTEKASEFTVTRLWLLLDKRYRDRRPTLFSSNYKPSELANHLAPKDEVITAQRIIDRITELAVWVEIKGPSHRKGVERVEWATERLNSDPDDNYEPEFVV